MSGISLQYLGAFREVEIRHIILRKGNAMYEMAKNEKQKAYLMFWLLTKQ